jgi:hypothetical protein
MDRYEYARRHGIKDQAVKIDDKKKNDALAREAEQLVARFLGVKWTEKRVDGGVDLAYRGWKIDVKWSGAVPFRPDRKTRFAFAGLKVPAWKPMKGALIYVAVHGAIVSDHTLGIEPTDEDVMKIYGWAFRRELRDAPVLDFGYKTYEGEPATMHVLDLASLHSREMLKAIPAFDPERDIDDVLAEAAAALTPGWAY